MLTSCATTAPLKTASGRPEVTIHNRSLAQVRAAAINFFVDDGWAPTRAEGVQLVFQKQGSTTQAVLMGLMTNNPQATNQVVLTLIENGRHVRVVAGLSVIGQNTFGAQQSVELQGKGYQQLQAALEMLKNRAEASG